MNRLPDYKTLAGSSSDEFVTQKSRFIAYAAPMQSQEGALNYIKAIREKHREATHHCYAYIIGPNAGIMRYQDDGEPSGTAGQPIMEVMKQQDLVNCCCVVVRYFGGVLLGAGGLTRAYAKACAMGIEAAGIAVMEASTRLSLTVPYPLWDRVQHRLSGLPVQLEDTVFTDQITVQLITREKDQVDIKTAITQVSDGRVKLAADDESFYFSWPSA